MTQFGAWAHYHFCLFCGHPLLISIKKQQTFVAIMTEETNNVFILKFTVLHVLQVYNSSAFYTIWN